MHARTNVRALGLPVAASLIPGLKYYLDFVTAEEESSLQQSIDNDNVEKWEQDFARRTQRYGFRYTNTHWRRHGVGFCAFSGNKAETRGQKHLAADGKHLDLDSGLKPRSYFHKRV